MLLLKRYLQTPVEWTSLADVDDVKIFDEFSCCKHIHWRKAEEFKKLLNTQKKTDE